MAKKLPVVFCLSLFFVVSKCYFHNFDHKYNGVPPLTIAASHGDIDEMARLVRQGHDVDQLDWIGQTAMHMAAKFQQTESIRFLLNHNANCCIPNEEFMETPLHLAAKTGSIEIIKLLLQKGADVNFKISPSFYPGGTPLMYAALYHGNSYETAKILLDNGAIPTIPNSQEQTALELYAEQGNLRTVINLIQKYGVDVNSLNGYGCTALYKVAAYYPTKWPVFEYLLYQGAKVQSRCWRSGKTPLHAASQMGHIRYVKSLVEHGANVNDKDNFLRTPLTMAVVKSERFDKDVIKMLLQRGADPNARSSNSTHFGSCDYSIYSAMLTRMRREGNTDGEIIRTFSNYGATVDPHCYENYRLHTGMLENNQTLLNSNNDGWVWRKAGNFQFHDIPFFHLFFLDRLP